MQVFDGINAKFGVNVKQFFTGLAILVGVLHTVFVFLWIKFQKKLAERDAEAEVCFSSFLVSCGGRMPRSPCVARFFCFDMCKTG